MTARECRCTWASYSADCIHPFHAAIALRPAPLPASPVPDVAATRRAFDEIVAVLR